MNINIFESVKKSFGLLFWISFFAFTTTLHAADYPQTNTLYERTWLATDRDVYIPGDVVCVSLATIDGYYQLPVTFSGVAYVEFYTADGTPVLQEKALLRDGKGAVTLHLPKDLSTDYYYIRAYTHYQKNFGEASFMVKKIRLINPFKVMPIEQSTASAPATAPVCRYNFRNDSLYIFCPQSILAGKYSVQSAFGGEYLATNSIKINDTTLAVPMRGMKNVLSIGTGDAGPKMLIADSAKNIHISAKSEGQTVSYGVNGLSASGTIAFLSSYRADQGRFADTYLAPSATVTVPEQFAYRPELSADMVYGKINLKSGSAMPRQILATTPGSVSNMKVAPVEPDGTFALSMTGQLANTPLLLTPTDSSSSISISLQDEFFPDITPIAKQEYKPETYLGMYIQSLMVNVQLADAFSVTKAPTEPDKSVFYGRWDESLIFDKFISLPSLEEYIHELMPSVYVKKKKKRKSIRISDYDSRGFIGNKPLLLVDGTPYFNHGTVLYIPPKEVEAVYILNRRLTYKAAQFDGVLDIRTRDNYSEALELAANTLSLNYIAPKLAGYEVPLFPNTIFCQPVNAATPSGQFTRIQPGAIILRMQGLADGKPFDVYSETIK